MNPLLCHNRHLTDSLPIRIKWHPYLLCYNPDLFLFRWFCQHLSTDKTAYHLPVCHNRCCKINQSRVTYVCCRTPFLHCKLCSITVTLLAASVPYLTISCITHTIIRKMGALRHRSSLCICCKCCHSSHCRKRILNLLKHGNINQICYLKVHAYLLFPNIFLYCS